MSYRDEKQYGSAKYHGMKVGGVHSWTYPDGQWQERKVAPDRWDVTFTSLKRRNRRAPADSGAEVGSGYHWLVVAHQWVEKLDANTYSTHLEGHKFLVAFRRADWPVWSTQMRNSRRHARDRTLSALREAIRRIESDGLDLEEPADLAALPDLKDAWKEMDVEQAVAVQAAEPPELDLGPGALRPRRRPGAAPAAKTPERAPDAAAEATPAQPGFRRPARRPASRRAAARRAS